MHNLKRILQPESLAVIGGDWAANVVEQCLKSGYSGKLWPINPHRSHMHGIPCIPSLDCLDAPPDCSFVGVNREESVSTLRTLAKMKGGGAICFASGFAETMGEVSNGQELQDNLVAASDEMPFLGPNCYGLINYFDGTAIWPDVHGGLPCDRGVALIFQSSNIAINVSMQTRGLPIGYLITVGNQAKVSLASIAIRLLDDQRVSAIGMYIEGFGDLKEFERLSVLAREQGVPLVALKVGNSQKSSTLAMSHSSSIAGSSAGSTALLKRLGIGQVQTVPELLEALKVLHLCGPLNGRRVASLSCSGGEACLMADLGSQSSLVFPPLSERQKELLRGALGSHVHLDNPMDYHTYLWGQEDRLTEVFKGMLCGDQDLTYLIIDFPRANRCAGHGWQEATNAFVRAAKQTQARAAVVSTLVETLPEDWCYQLMENNIVPLHGMAEAIKATEACAEIGERWSIKAPEPVASGPGDHTAAIADDTSQVRKRLADYGVKFPDSWEFQTIQELERGTSDLDYPVVLKVRELAHKTEHGGVVLNLPNDGALLNAARGLNAENGYLVEQYIPDPVAEMLIGITNEPQVGLMLTIGSGGILAELIEDAQHLLLPTDEKSIYDSLKRLKVWSLLKGYRGRSAGDIDNLVGVILGLARYAIDERAQLVEIEINPYFCMKEGGLAVDLLTRFVKG